VQRAVALLHFDQEVDARRAVQLVHDHALGAVDDELPAADHDRDFAEVDGVLHHLVLVLADEAHLDAEGHPVGQSQRAALVGRVARLRQVVGDVFKPKVLIVRFNGEDFAQERFQAVVLPLGGLDVLLQEFLVGLDLYFDQVRNGQRIAALAEVAHFVRSHQGFPRFLLRVQKAGKIYSEPTKKPVVFSRPKLRRMAGSARRVDTPYPRQGLRSADTHARKLSFSLIVSSLSRLSLLALSR
jgi:hypothetical protein